MFEQSRSYYRYTSSAYLYIHISIYMRACLSVLPIYLYHSIHLSMFLAILSSLYIQSITFIYLHRDAPSPLAIALSSFL